MVVSPSVIPAGGAVTLDVQGSGTNFTQGVTTVGFGTSDVLVNQITVISPTHLTVTVTPNVTISSANITIDDRPGADFSSGRLANYSGQSAIIRNTSLGPTRA